MPRFLVPPLLLLCLSPLLCLLVHQCLCLQYLVPAPLSQVLASQQVPPMPSPRWHTSLKLPMVIMAPLDHRPLEASPLSQDLPLLLSINHLFLTQVKKIIMHNRVPQTWKYCVIKIFCVIKLIISNYRTSPSNVPPTSPSHSSPWTRWHG